MSKELRKKLVVLTGAGVSAESGIKTFRDSDGLWENYKVEDVAAVEGWIRNPSLVLDFYNARRKQLKGTKPNRAHEIIAELEKDFDVIVVTQNVDNLHERAGSTRVLHLHGELTKVRPVDSYNNKDGYSEKEVIDIGYDSIKMGDLSPSGVQLRPHIVWFGEAVPNIQKGVVAVESADIIIIVGTSLQVYPAAGLYGFAKASTPIYLIDPKDPMVSDSRLTHIKKVATVGMEEVKNILYSK